MAALTDAESSGVSARPSLAIGVGDGAMREIVEALPLPTAVLDRAGIVILHNRAFAELLQLPGEAIVGEPFLGWLSRASEREGFGRAFVGLRDREGASAFTLELGIVPRLGPRAPCLVRAWRLRGGAVALTAQPSAAGVLAPETELGVAVTRSLDALDQGVMLVDGEGRVVHANPAALELIGASIVGRSVLELADAPSVPTLGRALALARSGSWQGELQLRRTDGEPLPVEVSLAGGTGPAVLLVRDLRDRRRREFEERLMGQVDRCLVSSAEPRHSVLAACAALAAGVGAPRVIVVARTQDGWERWQLHEATTRAIALPPGVVPPAAWDSAREVEPVDIHDPAVRACFGALDGVRAAVRTALRGPATVVGHMLLGSANASAWDARDRALVGAVSSQIGLGLANGLLTLATRELAAYQAMMLDQTTVLLDSVDAQGRIVTWNRASEQLLGVAGDDALGKRLGVEVAPPVDPRQWEALWSELVETGMVAREITLRALDGAEVPLHLEGRLLRHGPEVRGAVFVGLDMRDRRALERQILRSQKLAAVGLLAAGIAHEINNPLSGVVGYSKLLLESRLPPEVRERVEKIATSGARCQKIVEGVLLFSRQKEGGERRPVDLKRLLDRVLGIGEYQWRMHNIRIIREVEEDVSVLADADQIEQVVLNLLSNAVDAMPRGGSIRLRLETRPDGAASLQVADEGHGIPEEIQARIFDPFFSTKEIGKGTGLGLAISYGIVQDHGGDIVVESAPGRGAAFTVLLPRS